MEQLPRIEDTAQTGIRAVTRTQTIIEDHKWLFRRQDGQTDFGVDVEIEMVEKNLVTGRIFKGQVKGQEEIEWKNGKTSVQVKVTTYNLWKNMPLPVIAFLCDVKTRRVYWNLPISQTPRHDADSIYLKFEEQQSIPETFDVLEKLLQTWFRTFTGNILREVPYFHGVFTRLEELAGWGDPWSMLDEDDDGKCRLFYHHLMELRLSLGLPCEHLPSIDEWYLRSSIFWHDDGALFYGTFEELFNYIKPDYEEAIQALRKRVKHVERRFENQEIITFFANIDKEPGATRTSYTYMDKRASSSRFAQTFDEKLENRNVLKYRLTEAVNGS